MQRRRANGKPIPPQAIRRERRDRAYSLLLVVLTVGLAMSLFALVSTAVDRFGWRADLTENQIFRLTDETKDILAGLDRDVDLIYCNSAESADSNIKEILDRYGAASPRIGVTYMDLAANPAMVERWQERNIALSSDGVLIQSGSNARFVAWSELYALNAYTDESGTQRYTLTGLQAEAKITSAILAVTTQAEAKVAFTAGHSEDVPQALEELLSNGGYSAGQVVLGVQELDEDVSTLIVAGPRRDFSQRELEVLDGFMARGGNLMVFRDPEVESLPELDGYLASWGVTVEDEIVLEPRQQMDSPLNIIPVFGVSMMNVYFSETSTYLVMPECRALSLKSANGCIPSAVLRSTSAAYGKSYASMTSLDQQAGDAAGPFTVAALSERTYQDEAGQARTQYLFAAACTGFYSERYLQTGSLANGQLILQALAYMNDRDVAVNIPVKSLTADDIAISRGAVTLFAAVFVAAVPLGLLAAGAAVYLKRRRT